MLLLLLLPGGGSGGVGDGDSLCFVLLVAHFL
jgi:hypothetical protein